MSLSQKTIQNLALALKDDAVDYLKENADFHSVVMDFISEFLDVKLGEMDITLADELSELLLKSIEIK